MSKEIMLINATQSEETRVALVRDNYLYDLDIDSPIHAKQSKKGNIHLATVARCENSLDAVFVQYGSDKQGFLPRKEISPEYFKAIELAEGEEKPPISSLLKVGQQLLIQIDKEERGTKGAAITTFMALAGCYLVLMPNNPGSGGISRRIDGEERAELREILNSLALPQGMGIIIRTAGLGKNQEDLQADLDMLLNQWNAIKHAAQKSIAPCLIHQEGDVIIRAIRDNLRKSISEIIIDEQASYVKAKQYIEQVKPEFLPHLKLYNSAIPLFNFYQIEHQIESAYQRTVPLRSGGALVIDRTEALVSIDINSAKSTSATDIETTARNTNLEAADEIARQARLRDLSGLLVIDFIDMASTRNQRDVENRLKEALKSDRARIQVGRISRFGLLEMSRQRLRPSLGESAQEICPRCEGRGIVRNIQSHTLSILRLIEDAALLPKTAEVQIQLPVEMATYLMNEKRDYIQNIEKRHHVNVVIIANPYMQSPQYLINRLREEQLSKNKKPSYLLIESPEVTHQALENTALPLNEPAVKTFELPISDKKTEPGLIMRLWQAMFGASTFTATEKPSKTKNNTSLSSTTDATKKRPFHTNRRRKRPNSHTTLQKSHHSQNFGKKRTPQGTHGLHPKQPSPHKNDMSKKKEMEISEKAQ